MSISMKLLNIIYTNEMEASVAFYETLGLFRKEDGEVNEWWNEFPIGDASLALHWNEDRELPTESNPELHLQVSAAVFEDVHANMAEYSPAGIETMRDIGRFFTVTDPNGVRVQLNEEA